MPELLESTCNLERVAVIFNPASGTEDLQTRRTRLETLAREAGLTCDLTETDEREGATPLAREALADGMERLIVSGGDGSVTEAAGVVAGTEAVLAVVPGGTGNLLAVNLGLPTDAAEAMRLALSGPVGHVDVGRANGSAFLIMAGMGADARMIQDADRDLKNKLGPVAYFVAAWRNRRRSRAAYRITVDGRVIRRHAQTVMVANLGRVTGGVELVPDASPTDGLLEVAVLRARTPLDLIHVGLDALLGRPRRRDLLEIHRGRHIVIETPHPQPVQLDGNEAGSTRRLEVRVDPGALRLVYDPQRAQSVAELAPVAVLARGTRAVALAATAAVSTAGIVYLRERSRRGRGETKTSPRRPLLAGLAVGAGVYLAVRLSERQSVLETREEPPARLLETV